MIDDETELIPAEIEAACASERTARLARARAQLFSLEDRVKGQLKRHVFRTELSARDQRRPQRAIRFFSDALRETVARIDAFDDEEERCFFMNNLNFLLRISNNAGALIGDAAESAVEEKRKVAARNRQVRSLKADHRLPESMTTSNLSRWTGRRRAKRSLANYRKSIPRNIPRRSAGPRCAILKTRSCRTNN